MHLNSMTSPSREAGFGAMGGIVLSVALGVALASVFGSFFNPAAALQTEREERRSRRNEERKAESLERFSQQLSRLSSRPDLTPENIFLHGQVPVLLERARQAPAGSYLFDRLESAVDDLLDASENILESSEDNRDRDEDAEETNRRTARDLERTYFRILQGDYFASQTQQSNAAEYVLTARRLYQQARATYDSANHRRARRLAEAAREVIGSLESLAQAVVPIPEPPTLPEG